MVPWFKIPLITLQPMTPDHSNATSTLTLDMIRQRVQERREANATAASDLDEGLLASADLMVARWKRVRRLRADLDGGARLSPGPVDRLPRSLIQTLSVVAEQEAVDAITNFLWQMLEESADSAKLRHGTLRAGREAARAQLSEDGTSALLANPDYVPSDESRPVVVASHAADLYPPHDPLLLAASAMMEPWERAAALRDEWNRRALFDEPMTSEQRFELIAAIDEAASDASDAFATFLEVAERQHGDHEPEDDEASLMSALDAYARLTRPASGATPPIPSSRTSARPGSGDSHRAS